VSSVFVPGIEGPAPQPGDLLLLAHGLELAVIGPKEQGRLPSVAECGELADGLHFLGTIDGRPVFASPVAEGATLGAPLEWLAARHLFNVVDVPTFEVCGRAIAIAEWDRTHRFCGRCATPTELLPGERARRCPKCHVPYYPRIAPAVIVLIERDDEVLLAKGAGFPRPWYSTIAGFVEPGESLEQTVHREVREEVGLEITDLRYFGSQPWPFGRSLMVGFNARYAGGELKLDPKEILDAKWFRPDAMPEIPPKVSIAHELISSWLARKRRP
jgi:NAD+ diphosphatase